MYEALKAQEEAKTFYTKRIAEIIAKEFNILKEKGDLTETEIQNEILLLLQKNEPYILAKPSYVSPLKSTPPDRHQQASSNKKTARRRSFDNLAYDDIIHISTPPSSGRIALGRSETDGHILSGRIKSFVSDGGGKYPSSDPDAQFRKMCVESGRQIAAKKKLTYMAAVDGSVGGHIAFQTMMEMKKKLDHVCLFHAYSKDHDCELPTAFQSDAVRSRYENELITKLCLPTTKFTFYWEEKKKRDIRKVIMELLNNYKGVKNPMRPTRNEPNFFFCGYTGTKGSKVDNSTLGSVTDIALRSVHMPVVICKRPCASPSRFFIIAVDGSENSRNGFEIAMALVNPKDKLHCVTVEKNSAGSAEQKEAKSDDERGGDKDEEGDKHRDDKIMFPADVQHYYTTEMNSYGPANSEFISLTCASNETIAECLVKYSDTMQADFFAISPRARPIFTSVTEYIITTVDANIILCKN